MQQLCLLPQEPQNVEDDDEEEPYQPATVPPDPYRTKTSRTTRRPVPTGPPVVNPDDRLIQHWTG